MLSFIFCESYVVFLSGSESMQVFLSYIYICVAIGDPVIKTGRLGSSHQDGKVGIQLSRQEGWDPVIKTGRLGSSHQDGKVGIQLSRQEGWDPVIKTGRLGSSHQDGKVGIQLSRQEGWDPVIKCERCLFVYRVRGVDLFIVRGDCLFIE